MLTLQSETYHAYNAVSSQSKNSSFLAFDRVKLTSVKFPQSQARDTTVKYSLGPLTTPRLSYGGWQRERGTLSMSWDAYALQHVAVTMAQCPRRLLVSELCGRRMGTLIYRSMCESQMPVQEPEVEPSLLATQDAEIHWYLETLPCPFHYTV